MGSLLAVWVLSATAVASPGGPPSIALTFDDATDSPGLNGALLEALAGAKLRSVLFVAGRYVDSPQGLAQGERRYRSRSVTIDASDWYYDVRFRRWKQQHPGADPAPFRAAYLAHLWNRTGYYDALARKVLGRNVRHTLLLHTNGINAAFLPDVIRMFRDRKWQLIDAAAAFEDPVYDQQPNTLPAGQSVIWGLARARGEEQLRFPGENESYEKPILDAAGL
jgi:hypothetical protein